MQTCWCSPVTDSDQNISLHLLINTNYFSAYKIKVYFLEQQGYLFYYSWLFESILFVEVYVSSDFMKTTGAIKSTVFSWNSFSIYSVNVIECHQLFLTLRNSTKDSTKVEIKPGERPFKKTTLLWNVRGTFNGIC